MLDVAIALVEVHSLRHTLEGIGQLPPGRCAPWQGTQGLPSDDFDWWRQDCSGGGGGHSFYSRLELVRDRDPDIVRFRDRAIGGDDKHEAIEPGFGRNEGTEPIILGD